MRRQRCERLFCEVLGRPRVASRGALAVRLPPGRSSAEAVFPFPVRTGCAHNRLYFDQGLLKRPLPGSDPLNHKQLLAICEARAAEATDRSRIEQQVIEHLQCAAAPDAPMATVAAALGYSERSLRRRLDDAGVTYRDLVDLVRESAAQSLLTNTSKSIQTIAGELGFARSSNFSRSFKRWTGISPRDFRHGVLAEAPTLAENEWFLSDPRVS